jgi:hypothetical protein
MQDSRYEGISKTGATGWQGVANILHFNLAIAFLDTCMKLLHSDSIYYPLLPLVLVSTPYAW